MLFHRSHLFRTLVLEDFPGFLQLTLGINATPLPPPQNWAQKLQLLASQCLRDWCSKFGGAYQQVRFSRPFIVNYLSFHPHFDNSDTLKEITTVLSANINTESKISNLKNIAIARPSLPDRNQSSQHPFIIFSHIHFDPRWN